MQHSVLEPGSVVCVTYTHNMEDLKRALLLVDRIAVIHDRDKDWDCREKNPGLAADLDWLQEQGFVIRVDNASGLNSGVKELKRKDGAVILVPAEEPGLIEFKIIDGTEATDPEFTNGKRPFRVGDLREVLDEVVRRIECAKLRTQHVDAVTLTAPSPWLRRQLEQETRPGTILNLTMRKLPIPDEATPLEKVLEFRRDPSANASLLELRRWMAMLKKDTQDPIEVAQELDALLAQYDQHLRLHEIKASKTLVETTVTFIAEAAEDLVKVRWGKLAQSLFALSRRNVALLEAEANAPGRSISYVWKARKQFSQQ